MVAVVSVGQVCVAVDRARAVDAATTSAAASPHPAVALASPAIHRAIRVGHQETLAAGSARVPDTDCRDGVLQCAAPGGPVRALTHTFTVETGCSIKGSQFLVDFKFSQLSKSPPTPIGCDTGSTGAVSETSLRSCNHRYSLTPPIG